MLAFRSLLPSALLLPLVLASCSGGVVPRPGTPAPAPRPATPAPVAPVAEGMAITSPAAPGTWTYARKSNGTVAHFVAPDGATRFWLYCDMQARTILLGREDVPTGAAGMMTVRTTSGTFQWPMTAPTGGAKGVQVTRAATDPGLDAMAFSRGQFTLEVPGASPLVLPTWAEPVRVIEDCRG